MAYIGAQPNRHLSKATSQSFNGTGSATAFTLNRAVNSSEELEVFVDNVQQEPGSGKSYTATGTTLTFDEAPPSGTGNVYVIYRGQADLSTRLEAPDLSITTAKLADEAVTLAKLEHGTSSNDGKFLRANNGADPTFETVSTTPADGSITTAKIADDAVTAAKISTVDHSSFRNPIAFHVKATGGYITTDPIQFTNELFDLGSNFDTSNYTFTCPVNGIYSFTYNSGILKINSNNGYVYLWLTVNGVDQGYSYFQIATATSYGNLSRTFMLSLSANDTVQVRATANNAFYYGLLTTFMGHLVAAT